MNDARIAKLYEGLTNRERAALAFRYLTEGNELELARISSAVPSRTYVARDVEFTGWSERIFDMTCYWAISYWQAYAHRLEALVGLHIAVGRTEREGAMAMSEESVRWESRQSALQHALAVVCEEHGLDLDAAWRLASPDAAWPTFTNVTPDREYQLKMQADLSRILMGRGDAI